MTTPLMFEHIVRQVTTLRPLSAVAFTRCALQDRGFNPDSTDGAVMGLLQMFDKEPALFQKLTAALDAERDPRVPKITVEQVEAFLARSDQ